MLSDDLLLFYTSSSQKEDLSKYQLCVRVDMHLLFQYFRKVTDEKLKKAKDKPADVSIMCCILYSTTCIVYCS